MMKIFTLFIFWVGISVAGFSQVQPERPTTPTVKIVRFYPNPATTFINFEFQKTLDKSYSFQVFNFLGKKIIDLQQLTPRAQVDLTNYNRGVYIFQLKDSKGKVIESGKFQVEK
jgi:Secretion system C-terminal sorting domain